MEGKKIAIMQPYFLPYLGYFQLIKAVDEFVIYDNIQFTKRGWIHRNRILQNGQPVYISLPLKKDSDYLNVNQRTLADNYEQQKSKILAKLKGNYAKARNFEKIYNLILDILNYRSSNLFDFILNSIKVICDYLQITTPLIKSSNIEIDHNLISTDKVLEICKRLDADIYINPVGGKQLYDKADFKDKNIELIFHNFKVKEYDQIQSPFLSHLSIIDTLMFCDITDVYHQIDNNFEFD
jgi:hypothetical protein